MDSIEQTVSDEVLVAQAFERVKGELVALKADELLQLNVDVPSAVSTVLGVLPEVRALRDRMVKELPTFDVARFDKLEDYALALKNAQAEVLMSTEPADELQPIATEATRLRDVLLTDAQSLAKHGLIDGDQLSHLKGANGYKNIAQDLDVLTKLLQANWSKVNGKIPTVAADLDLASRISTRLVRIVGLREQGPASLAATADLRVRAFTLLINTYEDARRAVQFLRAAEGDADTIAPSLYPGRPRRRGVDQAANAAASGTAATPSTSVSTPTVPAQAVAKGSTVAATNDAAASRSNPFAS